MVVADVSARSLVAHDEDPDDDRPPWEPNECLLLVIACIAFAVPSAIAFILCFDATAVPVHVYLLRIEWLKPALVVVLILQAAVLIRDCACTWREMNSSIFWLWVSALPWTGEVPTLPLLGVLLVLPLCGRIVLSTTTDALKAYTSVARAATCMMILLVVGWVIVLVTNVEKEPRPPRFADGGAGGCPTNYTPVADFGTCKSVAVRLGLHLNATGARCPDSLDAGCCVANNFTRCIRMVSAHEASCVPINNLQEDERYVCAPVDVPRLERKGLHMLREQLSKDHGMTTLAVCEWEAAFNPMLGYKSAQDEAVCKDIRMWQRLFDAGLLLIALGMFVVAVISHLRSQYLRALSDASNPKHCETVANTSRQVMVGLVTLIVALFLALVIFDEFDKDPLFGRMFLHGVLVGILLVVIWVLREFQSAAIAESMGETVGELTKEVAALVPWLLSMEWVQASLVCTVSLAAIVLLACSALWQRLRRLCGSMDEESLGPLATKLFDSVRTWHAPAVLDKCFILGAGYLVVDIGCVQLSKVGLAVMKVRLKANIWIVVLVFNVVGVTMFMNPAIPGLPVYIAAGLIIIPATQQEGLDWPWSSGLLLSIACGLSVKQISTALQIVLGRYFGTSVRIRYMVGLHTPPMRAIEILLREPGFTFSKFAVLNGGPDWPTAVFSGMVGLAVIPVLWYTTPLIVVIAPTVIAGATLEYVGKDSPWAVVNSMSLLAATIFQSTLTFLAIRAISIVASDHKEELSRKRQSLDVLQNIEQEEMLSAMRLNRKTEWRRLPCGARLLICIAALQVVACAWVLVTLKKECFREFDLGSDYDAPMEKGGLEGDWLNVFKPLAVWILIVAAEALFLYFLYCIWVRRLPDVPDDDPEESRGLELGALPDAAATPAEQEEEQEREEAAEGHGEGRERLATGPTEHLEGCDSGAEPRHHAQSSP